METRIRRGGVQTPDGYLFELTGGDVSLDFVNTLDSRPTSEPRELLRSYSDFVSWAKQDGILSEQQESFLLKKAKQLPQEAERSLTHAISVRECLFRMLVHVTDSQEVPDALLAEWNRIVHRTMTHYQMVPVQDGFRWEIRSKSGELDSILWHVVQSAVQLLTGPHVKRIRRCASNTCDWMFLDISKRGNRRWCDMTVCGNRAKASRFYSRKKARA
jgi:predicted RNA-binding Zn ribbon-like protein